MREWTRNHGLLLANVLLFVVFFGGMAVTGAASYSEDQLAHGQAAGTIGEYLTTGAFVEATCENWEFEFLQMGMYVVLTAYLFQKGSSESKPAGKAAPQDPGPRTARNGPDTPWPVRRGGWVLKIYEHPLSGLSFVLFAASIVLHAFDGAAAYSEEQLAHGQPPVGALEYVGTSQFWFESFQNWQSEFLAAAVIVGASVYLQEVRCTESKPVAEPHYEMPEAATDRWSLGRQDPRQGADRGPPHPSARIGRHIAIKSVSLSP